MMRSLWKSLEIKTNKAPESSRFIRAVMAMKVMLMPPVPTKELMDMVTLRIGIKAKPRFCELIIMGKKEEAISKTSKGVI